MRPDLNIDLGELPNEPVELYTLAHRVNIACGGHAGDRDTMLRAIELATTAGASIGAHPSYPDRENFGRVSMRLPQDELRAALEDQLDALNSAADETLSVISYVKPHGALYHDANRDPALARILVEASVNTLGNIAVVGPPQGELRWAAVESGCPFRAEGFADRGYAPDGSLLPRGTPGALIESPEQAAEQALRLKRTGHYDTLCVHSDTPNAVAVARAVRAALEQA